MGAYTFTEESVADTAEAAFHLAVAEARDEYGNRGYTGTIAEKGDYRLATNQVMPRSQAYAVAEELRDTVFADKWGPAGAIAIVDDEGLVRTVTVEVSTRGEGTGEAKSLALSKVGLKAGESVVSTQVVGVEHRLRTSANATKGATQTRYVVRGIIGRDTWERGFDTQAQARAWAVEQVQARKGPTTVSIEAITRRAGGEPLVVVSSEPLSSKVRVEVVIRTAKPAPAKTDQWLFFGWASS